LPAVTVIIPVYNGEQFLAAAIESVRQQTYKPLEVIIVDDGSTDHSAAIVANYRTAGLGAWLRYLHQANAGPAVARNYGLALAQGEVIAFLDADDLWPANKLQVQVAQLVDEPGLQLVWGHYQTLVLCQTETNARAFVEFAQPALSPLLGSMLIRKNAFDQIGLFDPAFTSSEDVDWIMRVREVGCSLKVMPEVTLFYRLHGQNLTHRKTLVQLKYVQALRQSLVRRRQKGNDLALALPALLPKE